MKLTYSGTSEGNSGCIDFDTGSNFQVDTSWYNANWICNHWSMKVDPNFQWDLVQGKFKASRWKTSGDQEVADTYMHGGYMSMECPYGNCNITCGGGNDNCFQINYSFRPSVNPAAANWQAYTWAFKEQSAPGASDGQVALWVNGVLIGRVTGARFTDGLSVGPVMMGYSLPGTMMSPYPQAPNGTLWLDDFSQTIGRSECTPHTLSSSGSAPIINTAPPPPVLLP